MPSYHLILSELIFHLGMPCDLAQIDTSMNLDLPYLPLREQELVIATSSYLKELLKEKNIEIFAVNIDKDRQKWLKKVEETEAEWINCYDPDESSNFREKYYVFGSPLLYVIDKSKKITSRWNGEEEIKALCEKLAK